MNRDEDRSRAAEGPPAWRDLPNGLRAIWPTDTLAGGTWIAARPTKHKDAHGPRVPALVVAITNLNPDPPPALPPKSQLLTRGKIIPKVIGSASAEAALGLASTLDFDRHAPFRLVAVDAEDSPVGDERPRVLTLAWDGRQVIRTRCPDGPACFPSSGLGDAKVHVRIPLFDELVSASPGPVAQDRFHRHRWAERPELSVLMAREDARTLSITTVEVRQGVVEMRYEPVPDAPAGQALSG